MRHADVKTLVVCRERGRSVQGRLSTAVYVGETKPMTRSTMSMPEESGTEWVCPHCQLAMYVQEEGLQVEHVDIGLPRIGPTHLRIIAIVCPRARCRELSLQIALGTPARQGYSYRHVGSIPRLSQAKSFPAEAGIPDEVIADYREGAAILRESPKAAATMFRRALQGMIRHRWGIKNKPHLYAEIKAIRHQVSAEVRQALLDVKDMGNIGAHMEQDVNLVLDVTAEEASALMAVIEMVMNDWYVEQMHRKTALAEVHEITEAKRIQRQQAAADPPEDESSRNDTSGAPPEGAGCG